ncbi:MAG TPA: M1 family aminopeptidase, partial [Candidatus Paceibacterota bacterium]|nr:M1 family aminopeptidase [Candidatus Paceibacterota bacterium]
DYSDNMTAFRDRTHLVYDKGAYVLAMLHKEIGDDMFLSFLRNFQARYAWKYATTQDMVALLQQLTKKDYSDFFEKNFWGTEMPQG